MSGITLTRAEEAWPHLQRVLDEGAAAPDAEAALRPITRLMVTLLGDKDAPLRPGGLKEGERQYVVSCVVVVSPDRASNVFIAQEGFPPEQHHLVIPIGHGHPGTVVREQKPLLLANTDDHGDFKQILKTSRMGSSLYVPMFWQGKLFGQLIAGSQARYSFRPVDLEVIVAFARVGALLWGAHKGPENLARIIAA